MLLPLQDDIGHVLVHTSTPPDYSDYVELNANAGNFDADITNFEGASFEENGVLDAIVQKVLSCGSSSSSSNKQKQK